MLRQKNKKTGSPTGGKQRSSNYAQFLEAHIHAESKNNINSNAQKAMVREVQQKRVKTDVFGMPVEDDDAYSSDEAPGITNFWL